MPPALLPNLVGRSPAFLHAVSLIERVARRALPYLADETALELLESADALRTALDETEPGRVEDPRIGRGLFITWSADSTLAKWPLDHILPSAGAVLSGMRVMPAFGSDHLPLVADLCVTGRPGVPRPLDPAVRARAEAVVAHGQGRAGGPDATP